jgi:GH25 family lysozyme M1 (1,4-beta-N-acetylmuramidase)
MHDPGRGPGRRSAPRRPLLGLGGAAVAALALLASAPGGTAVADPISTTANGSANGPATDTPASPTTAPAGTEATHPELDWMGSSIAAHEGPGATAGTTTGTGTGSAPGTGAGSDSTSGTGAVSGPGSGSASGSGTEPGTTGTGTTGTTGTGTDTGSGTGTTGTGSGTGTTGTDTGTAPLNSSVPRTVGFDVSNWQGTINWPAAYAKGARFAYIKATEGTTYKDPYFNSNYVNAYKAGFIRGAYHFARPNASSGKAQADYFVTHGGGWSKDGRTLPPLLDIEYPSGAACYGLSQSAMRAWIAAFVNEVHARTTRWATIYTTTNWWKTCTGNTSAFAANDPLFIAHYASTPGTLPAGWPFYSFWQHADSGSLPGNQDYFNGPLSGVRNLADNT